MTFAQQRNRQWRISQNVSPALSDACLYNLMGPPSYMRFVVDRNVFMRRVPLFSSLPLPVPASNSIVSTRPVSSGNMLWCVPLADETCLQIWMRGSDSNYHVSVSPDNNPFRSLRQPPTQSLSHSANRQSHSTGHSSDGQLTGQPPSRQQAS